jgi:hypothetical protein
MALDDIAALTPAVELFTPPAAQAKGVETGPGDNS